jgi:hypothetical protein
VKPKENIMKFKLYGCLFVSLFFFSGLSAEQSALPFVEPDQPPLLSLTIEGGLVDTGLGARVTVFSPEAFGFMCLGGSLSFSYAFSSMSMVSGAFPESRNGIGSAFLLGATIAKTESKKKYFNMERIGGIWYKREFESSVIRSHRLYLELMQKPPAYGGIDWSGLVNGSELYAGLGYRYDEFGPFVESESSFVFVKPVVSLDLGEFGAIAGIGMMMDMADSPAGMRISFEAGCIHGSAPSILLTLAGGIQINTPAKKGSRSVP